MITLTLLEPQKKTQLKQWRLEDESVIRIGRSPDNQIVLNDSLVSRHHLELRKITSAQGSSWVVTSQGTNGTFLDGVLVTQRTLPDNCLLQLAQGGPILKFQTQSETAPQEQPLLNTCNHQGNNPNNLFCVRCGQPISVQRTIRHYQVLRTLGQGGMGDDLSRLGCRQYDRTSATPGVKGNECGYGKYCESPRIIC